MNNHDKITKEILRKGIIDTPSSDFTGKVLHEVAQKSPYGHKQYIIKTYYDLLIVCLLSMIICIVFFFLVLIHFNVINKLALMLNNFLNNYHANIDIPSILFQIISSIAIILLLPLLDSVLWKIRRLYFRFLH